MKLTVKFLESKDACQEGIDWFAAQKETDVIKIVNKLMKEKRFDWANWLIVHKMKYKQYVSYAVFAAEQVIDIFEKKYPDDKKPQIAIEAARACIKNPSKKNKEAAADAAYAADAAAYAAAYAADAAAYAAAYAAYAADAAYAAYAADAAAAYAAAYAAMKKKMQIKIISYGIKLLKEGVDG